MLIVVCLYLHRALLDWMANQDRRYVFAVYLLHRNTHLYVKILVSTVQYCSTRWDIIKNTMNEMANKLGIYQSICWMINYFKIK